MALGQAQHTLRGNKYLELYGVVVRWGHLRGWGVVCSLGISSEGCGGQKQLEDILGGLRWPLAVLWCESSPFPPPDKGEDKKIVYTSRFVRVILAQGPC